MSVELLRLLEKLGIVCDIRYMWDPNYNNGMGSEVWMLNCKKK